MNNQAFGRRALRRRAAADGRSSILAWGLHHRRSGGGAYGRVSSRPLIDDMVAGTWCWFAKKLKPMSRRGLRSVGAGRWGLVALGWPCLRAHGQAMPPLSPRPDTAGMIAGATDIALVIDLPGENLLPWRWKSPEGYRPVHYNACTGPNEVIDQQAILRGLVAGNDLPSLPLPADAPPRSARCPPPPTRTMRGVFDNR